MCIIVDNNVIATVLFDCADKAFGPIRKRLFNGRRILRLAYGGRLLEEYKNSQAVIRVLSQLDRSARMIRANDNAVNIEETIVLDLGICVSNDPHIVALARVTNVRVLVSKDKDLQKDFKNLKLLNPKGKIYKRPAHSALLKSCTI